MVVGWLTRGQGAAPLLLVLQRGTIEGTDAAAAALAPQGVREHVHKHMRAFVRGGEDAADAADANGTGSAHGKKGASRGSAADDDDKDEEDEEEERAAKAAAALDRRRAYALDQVLAAMRFPGATAALQEEVMRFLAAAALFAPGELRQAPAAATSTPAGKKAAVKKAAAAAPQQQQQKASAEVLLLAEAAEGGGGGAAPALSQATRELCAQRLLTLAAHAPAVPGAGGAADGEEGEEKGEPTNGKKAKKAKKVRPCLFIGPSRLEPESLARGSVSERRAARLPLPLRGLLWALLPGRFRRRACLGQRQCWRHGCTDGTAGCMPHCATG